jgi:hypothetical protein
MTLHPPEKFSGDGPSLLPLNSICPNLRLTMLKRVLAIEGLNWGIASQMIYEIRNRLLPLKPVL